MYLKEIHYNTRMIYNQDCMEAMIEMTVNQFDLAIVDPPDGNGISGQIRKTS